MQRTLRSGSKQVAMLFDVKQNHEWTQLLLINTQDLIWFHRKSLNFIENHIVDLIVQAFMSGLLSSMCIISVNVWHRMKWWNSWNPKLLIRSTDLQDNDRNTALKKTELTFSDEMQFVTHFLIAYRNLLASRSDSRRVRMSPSRTGPFTLRIIWRFCSPMNSTFTCVHWPWEPVRPNTLITRAKTFDFSIFDEKLEIVCGAKFHVCLCQK